MGTIRIEFVPIKKYNLGILGLDHLQIVYEDETSFVNRQDNWYVLEGTHDGGLLDGSLGVLGEEFFTELSAANGANGDDLLALIGTPEARGSRIVYQGADALARWEQMMEYGREIQEQEFPYEGLAWPFSPGAIMNSSSVVATLLFSIGVDVNLTMPTGIRNSPGTSTLLGTTTNDNISIAGNFTQAAGGFGEDLLRGSDNFVWPEKFFGGLDDDTIMWSKGENFVHGGEPRTPYALDGQDTIDYSGVGSVYIASTRHGVEHKVAQFEAVFDGGGDQLFSIEVVKFFRETDIITAGQGVDLIEKPVKLNLDDSAGGRGDELGFSDTAAPLIINAVNDTMVSVQTVANQGLDAGYWAESVEWIAGSSGDDLIYAGATLTGAEGGAGNDLIDGRFAAPFVGISPLGFDVELYGNDGSDTIVSGLGWTYAEGGEGDDTFVLSNLNVGDEHTEFVIADADDGDKVYVPYDFFKVDRGGYEGSDLFQLSGAPFKIDAINQTTYFHWGLPDDNEVDGFIEFVGEIGYSMDGADLIIRLKLGHPVVTELYDGPDEPLGIFETTVLRENESETTIRVLDWQDGDLGISFPISYNFLDFANAGGLADYPGFADAVAASVSSSKFISPLAERPEAYLPQDLVDNNPPLLAARSMNLLAAEPAPGATEGDDIISMPSGGPYEIHGLGGNDTLSGSSGSDVIDGGAGADLMSGQRGNDTYFVDDAGDAVIEGVREGFDHVYSAISYALGDNVEHLTLLGTARSGTGNTLRNTIAGNDTDNVLIAGTGDDTLAGNRGNDELRGEEGSDGYVYELGDGNDIIVETATDAGDDVLVLAGGMRPEDVRFYRDPAHLDDLILRFFGGGSIKISDYFGASGPTIEGVEFVSGPTWNSATVEDHAANAVVSSNADPIAADDYYVFAGENTVRLPVAALLDNDRDEDGDALAIVGIASVTEGNAAIEGGEIVITAGTGTTPRAAFDYVVSDGKGGTATAHAEIDFWPNAAPVISSSALAPISAAGTAAGSITATDADGDRLILSVKTGNAPALGSVTIGTGGTFLYTANAGASGTDTFTLLVSDPYGAAAEQSFTVSISQANAIPVVTSATIGRVVEDTVALGAITATDSDGDTLVYAIKSGAGPAKGSVTLAADGTFTYAPDTNETGSDTFTLIVTDPQGASAEQTFNVAIEAVNDTPQITAATIGIVTEDESAAGAITAIDADGDLITYSVKTGAAPSKGTVDLTPNGTFAYSPNANAHGPETFTLIATDSSGATAEQVFSFAIVSVNDAPVAADDTGFTMNAGATRTFAAADLLANDSDVDGDSLTISAVSAVQGGTVSLAANGTVTFTAAAGYSGTATFDYTVTDGAGGSAAATVSVAVQPQNPSSGVTLVGTDHRDVLTGTANADTINGRGGRDYLSGLGGDDVFLVSGDDDGIDQIDGGAGYDTLRGSARKDTFFVKSGLANITCVEEIDGRGGRDTIEATSANDSLDFSRLTLKNIERIKTGNGHDRVTGSSANDTFELGQGRDTLIVKVGSANDTVLDFESNGRCAQGDIIDISAFGFQAMSEVYARLSQVGHDTVLRLDGATSVTFDDTRRSEFHDWNFRIA